MEFAIEDVAAAISDDPACAGLLQRNAAVLLWDRSGERLIWSSSSAAGLREAFAVDGAGRPDPKRPASDRLQALGRMAPRRGARLERFWFDPGRIAPPVTCAFRMVTLPSGEELLLTALLGPEPRAGSALKQMPRRSPSQPREFADTASGPVESLAASSTRNEAAAAEEVPAYPGRTVRFTWRADPATRFTAISHSLGEVVGAERAAIVGRAWREIVDGSVADPSGAVADLFARRETWSGRVVHWRIGDSKQAVAVELAGMPVFSRERSLLGFRGFGLCRADTLVPWLGASPGDRNEPTDDAATPADGVADAPQVAGSGDAAASLAPPETIDAAVDRSVAVQPLNGTATGVEDAHPSIEKKAAGAAHASALTGLRGTVVARLGPQRPAPLRAVEEPAPNDAEQARTIEFNEQALRRAADSRSRLSVAERSAFREIARALGARYAGDDPIEPGEAPRLSAEVEPVRPSQEAPDPLRILDRLPIGVLVHRGEQPIFANRVLLDWIGYADTAALIADGGVARLFQKRPDETDLPDGAAPLTLSIRQGPSLPVEVRLTTVDWGDAPAGFMLIRRLPEGDRVQRLQALELELKVSEARLQELSAILDTATDGVLVLDEAGRILSLNRSAEALFGYDQNEVTGEPFTVLLAPEIHAVAIEYLTGLQADGMASVLNDGREVLGRVRQGGIIPLFMTMGRVNEGPERKFCCVLRDITAYKQAEGELRASKKAAEELGAQRSDLLAKINHDIRTPLNAIIGFAEVMLGERFGPIGNDRYKEYLKDIHGSGRRIVKLVDDLLDLAKAEAGQLELSFAHVDLSALVGDCIAQLQPQASRERILMRTSFAARQPAILADQRTLRQAVLNILSNAIRFTDAGGQMIVSTAATDRGLVALRVRDTGVGMTSAEIEAALKPFRQVATARRGDGAGLGLSLAKALVAANHGALQITSAPGEGTLVEILFPPKPAENEESPPERPE